jgi:molecular chaperone DnaK
LVEARNQADVLLHSTEKNVKEFGDAVAADERQQIEDDIEALRGAKDGEDIAAIKSKIEALSNSAMKLGEAMYKAQSEGQAEAGAEAETDGGDGSEGGAESDGTDADADAPADDVVDADFEEIDEDKKSTSA